MNQRLVAAALVAVLGLGAVSFAIAQVVAPNDRSSAGPVGRTDGQLDPESGLPWVDRSTLPPEALDTLDLIAAGGPFPYAEDGGTFGNFEGLLPVRNQGHYQEYTVRTPGSADRGALRIVTGADGELYWTADHYRSFERILR